jgi:cytidine deaminase
VANPIEAVPDGMRQFIPRLDIISTDIAATYAEADVAYAGLSTITLATHEIAAATEDHAPFRGFLAGAVGLGWNEAARTMGQFVGMNNVARPTDGTSIHAEAVVAAKARDFGMQLLYLTTLRPLQEDDGNGMHPCGNCRDMMEDPLSREFSTRTMIISGVSPRVLQSYTLSQLMAFHDPTLRKYVSITTLLLPDPADNRAYQNMLFHDLYAQWASVYPEHAAARHINHRGRRGRPRA